MAHPNDPVSLCVKLASIVPTYVHLESTCVLCTTSLKLPAFLREREGGEREIETDRQTDRQTDRDYIHTDLFYRSTFNVGMHLFRPPALRLRKDKKK